MKIHLSAETPEYSRLAFPYLIQASPSGPDEIPLMYNLGFLPVSRIQDTDGPPLFYLARSARVRLADFRYGRKERYVERYIVEHIGSVTSVVLRTSDALEVWPDLPRFCFESASRFAPGEFGQRRIESLLQVSVAREVVAYMDRSGQLIGCVLIVTLGEAWHTWFSFHQDCKNLGKYILLRTIAEAQEAGMALCYLGTVCGEMSRYKIVSGLEFFDEGQWSQDINKLKRMWSRDDDNNMDHGRCVSSCKEWLEVATGGTGKSFHCQEGGKMLTR